MEIHYVNRSNWLRAAVLGANDGILSTASIAVGIAAASELRDPIILASVAGLVAGALSMAAGEYVSVSSQSDIENSDLEREKKELEEMPEEELLELAEIYENRGLNKETALSVAQQLTAHNALEAHARDELGIQDLTKANPLQAALASAVAFLMGGALPLLVSIYAPLDKMITWQYVSAIFFLAILGAVSAKVGGSKFIKPVLRIVFWGTLAMGVTAAIGYLFNVQLG